MSDLVRRPNAAQADLPQAATLARLDAANQALMEAKSLEEVKDIRDKIAAIEGYYRQQKASLDVIAHATILKVRAEHKLGTLLKEMPKNRGSEAQLISRGIIGGNITLPPINEPPTYEEIGINKMAASRWQQLAEIPCEELEERIKEAAAEGIRLSVSRAVKEIHKEQQPSLQETPPLPPGTFDLILADPPWPTDFRRGTGRDFENHYPPMSLEAIQALGVPGLAAPDSTLFLWAVSMLLPQALEVMHAWGFTYKASMVWVKDRIGMGYYARLCHEFLLIGTRGRPGNPAGEDRPASVIFAERGAHSEKPQEFHTIIERMYPAARRIELFARSARPGWTLWGAEAPTG